MRRCPSGKAWADVTASDGTAHNLAECSGRGECDTHTGRCLCDPMFEGKACDRLACPDDCNGRGECLTMRAAAQESEAHPTLPKYELPWDAAKISGCSCDGGWGGFDCTERVCPAGDDPLTTQQQRPTVVLRCDYPAGTSSVRFKISRGGHTTIPIRPQATASDLREALEALPGLGQVHVVIQSASGTTSTICEDADGDGSSDAVVIIALADQKADFPPLLLKHADGRQLDGEPSNKIVTATGGQGLTRDGDAAVIVSTVGTAELQPCSGRGLCLATGDCKCFAGFASSDGQGMAGSRGDCGFAVNGAASIKACAGQTADKLPCSGHGRCLGAPSWRCECDAGFAGGDCSVRSCPSGRAWFDVPLRSPDSAHATAECSSMGKCDRVSGQCRCRPGFTGAACDLLECPGVRRSQDQRRLIDLEGREGLAEPAACSSHGKCLTMRRLADFAGNNGVPVSVSYGLNRNDPLSWDADSARGCLCDDGWAGHDCARLVCARGNDAGNDKSQATEAQAIVCKHLQGTPTFKLGFRGETTAALSHTSSTVQVKEALESLRGIGTVDVSFGLTAGSPTAACTSGTGTTITLTFKTEHGDLPQVTVPALDGHTSSELAIQLTATETRKGTTEVAECNDRGLCDAGTGSCKCFPGWGSSDGMGGPGLTDDCGYRVPYQSLPGPFPTSVLRRRIGAAQGPSA